MAKPKAKRAKNKRAKTPATAKKVSRHRKKATTKKRPSSTGRGRARPRTPALAAAPVVFEPPPAGVAAGAPAPAGTAGPATIRVPDGSTFTVIVDVGPMTVPCTVALDGRTIFKSLVDRAEPVPLGSGRRILGWAFAHTVPGWHHTIAYAIDNRQPIVLESRSDAKKDQDHSVGFALINP
jgi:hypothetical protein